MFGILKRNSTYAFQLGPFVSSTDAFTPSTGLTISSAAVVISKNGSSFVSKNDGEALTGTEDTRGFYLCRLNSTDLDTPGPLRVYVRVANALPVWHTFEVVSSQVYNSIWSTSGVEYLGVNVVQLKGQSSGADQLEGLSTTVQAESTKVSTQVAALSALASSGFSSLVSTVAGVGAAVLAESTKLSTAIYGESTKLSTQIAAISLSSATVDSTAIANAVWGSSAASTTIAGSVWNAQRSSYTSSGTFGDVVPTTEVAVAVWSAAIPSTFSTGTAGAALALASSGAVDSTSVANAVWAATVPSTFAAGSAGLMLGGIVYKGIAAVGTAQNSDSTSLTLASSHAFANDELNGAVIFISSGTGFGQSRMIVDYDGATDKATVDAWATTPSSVCDYIVFAAPPASTAASALPHVNVVRMDTNVITAEAVSDAAVTKISSGLATSTTMSTGFAAVTSALSTMAASIALRATSTEVSTGFAAQTLILSTMAAAQSSGFSSLVSTVGGVGAAVIAESTKLSTQIAAIAGASTLTAAECAAAVLGSTVDGAYTLTQVQRGMAAVLLGLASGSSGSTTVFRDVSNTKTRITAVTDTSGNRTSITLDLD